MQHHGGYGKTFRSLTLISINHNEIGFTSQQQGPS